MNKRRKLIAFSLLLLMFLLPNSAFAAPGGKYFHAKVATALTQFLSLVSGFLSSSAGEFDGRCGADPWGCANGPADGDLGWGLDPDGDIGHGWDPWGSPTPPSGTDDGDIGPFWDPWG